MTVPPDSSASKLIHAKRGRAVDDGIVRVQEQAAEIVQQFVSAVAGQDVVGRHADVVGQRLAQFALLRIRINMIPRKTLRASSTLGEGP